MEFSNKADQKDEGNQTTGYLGASEINYNNYDESNEEPSSRKLSLNDKVLDVDSDNLKKDIVRLIGQYLDSNGLVNSKMVLYDEINIKRKEKQNYINSMIKLKELILDGQWEQVEEVLENEPYFTTGGKSRGIQYRIYKQKFLECIEEGEKMKGYGILGNKLKGLERNECFPGEYKELCYLLTAKSIQDAPMFKGWDGITSARQRLAEEIQSVLEIEMQVQEYDNVYIPQKRLETLLQQAVMYQIQSNRYQNEARPTITTLLQDYEPIVVPNNTERIVRGHKGNVKCGEFIDESGDYFASGASDNVVKIWEVETGQLVSELVGHTSRVWDLTVDKEGRTMVTGSGDKTVKIWDIRDVKNPRLVETVNAGSDVYTVRMHPLQSHIIFAGYDKVIRMYDIEAGKVVQSFNGHELSVSRALVNPLGNLIISGSKDHSVRFWDIMSGSVVNKITTHLGEVTNVSVLNSNSAMQLLTSAKDNSNRLWDLRALKLVGRYKGHQNTSKNFIRANFMNERMVVSGSEDGKVYLYDKDSGVIKQVLSGHQGVVYEAKWNSKKGTLISFSDDRTLRFWNYLDEGKMYA